MLDGEDRVDASLLGATVESIAQVQLADGMIPWFPGGHADPWNQVEAAMALAVGGRRTEAERAYEWLARTQHPDGSWYSYYLEGGVEDTRRDANMGAYVATGTWHHHLLTGDDGFLETMWPVVEGAVGFALGLQTPTGEIIWSIDPDGRPAPYALLTGSSSIYLSLRCAIAVAEHLGHERPDWELAAGALAHAVAHRRESFEPKERWAMDWYYPVLCGAVGGDGAGTRLAERWGEFVMDGRGVRCVADRPWVTAAETCECVMACESAGWLGEARRLFSWAQQLRDDDGSYWTGCVYPEEVHFPGGERSTYTAAAVVLAADTLARGSLASGLFLGEGLPAGLDLAGLDLDLTEPGREPNPHP